jgi:hypothetical protein
LVGCGLHDLGCQSVAKVTSVGLAVATMADDVNSASPREVHASLHGATPATELDGGHPSTNASVVPLEQSALVSPASDHVMCQLGEHRVEDAGLLRYVRAVAVLLDRERFSVRASMSCGRCCCCSETHNSYRNSKFFCPGAPALKAHRWMGLSWVGVDQRAQEHACSVRQRPVQRRGSTAGTRTAS